MFGWFKSSGSGKGTSLDYSPIAVDLHSHILPGIDDGAKTVEDSIELIKAMMELGIRQFIATPHIMYDYYRNTPETVNAALDVLRAELVKQQIDVKIGAAAEYFFDEFFIALVQSGNILSFGADKYVLMEFSFVSPPPVFIPTLQQLKDKGYKPILAHPERYPYYTLDEYRNLVNWGFLLQVNTISLTGYYGKESKKIAEQLIDNNLVSFIASDMHHPRHAAALKAALKEPYVQRILKEYPLRNNSLLS